MRRLFQECTYDQMKTELTKIAGEAAIESLPGFTQQRDVKLNPKPESPEYKRNLHQVEIDLPRTVVLYEKINKGKDFEENYILPWKASVRFNSYIQGDIIGATPGTILRYTTINEFMADNNSFRIAYQNDAGEICGITLDITVKMLGLVHNGEEYGNDENLESCYAEPLQLSLSIVKNTTGNRYPDNPKDPQQPFHSLFVSNGYFSPDNQHGDTTTLTEIYAVIGSRKIASWVHFILQSKNSKQLYGALALHHSLRLLVDLSESGITETTIRIDMPAIDCLSDLSESDRNLLGDIGKFCKYDRRTGIPHDSNLSIFLCYIIAHAESTALRELCQDRLTAVIAANENHSELLERVQKYIQKPGRETIITFEQFSETFNMKPNTEINYREVRSSQLNSKKQQVTDMLQAVINLIASYAEHYKENPDTAAITDNISMVVQGLTQMLTLLKENGAWCGYAIKLHQTLQDPESLRPESPNIDDLIHRNLKQTLPENTDYTVATLKQALFTEVKKHHSSNKDTNGFSEQGHPLGVK